MSTEKNNAKSKLLKVKTSIEQIMETREEYLENILQDIDNLKEILEDKIDQRNKEEERLLEEFEKTKMESFQKSNKVIMTSASIGVMSVILTLVLSLIEMVAGNLPVIIWKAMFIPPISCLIIMFTGIAKLIKWRKKSKSSPFVEEELNVLFGIDETKSKIKELKQEKARVEKLIEEDKGKLALAQRFLNSLDKPFIEQNKQETKQDHIYEEEKVIDIKSKKEDFSRRKRYIEE